MRTNWKSIYISMTISAILLVLPGCQKNTGNVSPAQSIFNVEVISAAFSSIENSIGYSGTIEQSETTPLCFSGIGTVTKVYVSEGDFVKKGQLLAELNSDSYKNMYDMSLASLKQAEDAYKRLQPMYKNGNLPEIKLIEVETGLQQAKASAAIAKKNLEDCKLYSPVAGTIGKRSIDPGMSAMPNLASLTIVNINKVFAVISVPENDIPAIKKGAAASVTIAALKNNTYTGTVEETGVVADPLSHTYKIKIGIKNNADEIKPGMICTVKLNNEKHNTLVVPAAAVSVDEKGRNYLYTVAGSPAKAARKFVSTGRLFQNSLEVLSGLNEGDKIVVTGRQKLFDNAAVNIVNN